MESGIGYEFLFPQKASSTPAQGPPPNSAGNLAPIGNHFIQHTTAPSCGLQQQNNGLVGYCFHNNQYQMNFTPAGHHHMPHHHQAPLPTHLPPAPLGWHAIYNFVPAQQQAQQQAAAYKQIPGASTAMMYPTSAAPNQYSYFHYQKTEYLPQAAATTISHHPNTTSLVNVNGPHQYYENGNGSNSGNCTSGIGTKSLSLMRSKHHKPLVGSGVGNNTSRERQIESSSNGSRVNMGRSVYSRSNFSVSGSHKSKEAFQSGGSHSNHHGPISSSNTSHTIVGSSSHAMGAPSTPNDSNNCSFTFDDLKNTLAFMDDSPLVNSNAEKKHSISSRLNSSDSKPISYNLSTSTISNENNSLGNKNPSSLVTYSSSLMGSSSALTVIPTIVTDGGSSSLSSSSSVSPSCRMPSSSNTMPSASSLKSGSTPMLLSSGSTASVLSTSPSSVSSSLSQRMDCFHHHDEASSNYPSSSSSSLIATAPSCNLLNKHSVLNHHNINLAVETAAKKYRCAAQVSEASCSWKGKLPPKQYKMPIVYSNKVFVGGLPWDITEDDLLKEFGQFGPLRVEWTNKDRFNLMSYQGSAEFEPMSQFNGRRVNGQRFGEMHSKFGNQGNESNNSKQRASPGFAYIIYENEYSVHNLVSSCIEDYQNGRDRVEYYFKISTRRVRNKEVQIIPWILADNNFALCMPKELDPKKTVFVGNLHGTMTARDLAHVMNELFGSVVYAGIDIDKLKYPIGSGRVTFSHHQNFMRAVRAAFVDLQTNKFNKRIQIDPYLEDVACCLCSKEKGIYFCRDFQCFNYYCGSCWSKQHSFNSQIGNHKPLMRKREDK